MSNFYKLEHCRNCEQMTNHLYADDMPRKHEYTTICQKCKLETEVKNRKE